jgi:serine/threonine protein kinase
MMPNLTGQSIGRYQIIEQLGEGGMATVYKAYDTRLERDVAVKLLRTDQFIPAQLDMVLQRFEREAKSLAKLKHANIVNILDFGEHEGKPYLVMEYLPGGTLKQKLGQTIPWQTAFHTLLPIARGLAYAHQHNLIHRDVKPGNILIDENEEPILTDFGIAKLLEGTEGHTLTGTGIGIGTPEYMAPEQGIGASNIDARVDIYSLGIVLYEMITGRKPYIADTPMAVVLKQMNDPLPLPKDFVPDLPESVEHILFKALAKQPEDRYVDMNALIAAMEGLLAETPKAEVPATPASSKQAKKKAAPRAKPSGKVIKIVIGMLVAITMIVLGVIAAPSIGSYLSPTPTNTPSPTATSAATSTATPTLTSTITPTHTPRPTPTATPTPVWVPNFVEPMLDRIENVNPDFTEDFSNPNKDWELLVSDDGSFQIEEGVARFNANKKERLHVMHGTVNTLTSRNFILEIDARSAEGDVVQELWIHFNPSVSNVGFQAHPTKATWGVLIDSTQGRNSQEGKGNISPVGQYTHITLILAEQKIALLLNGNPIAYLEDSSLDEPQEGFHLICDGGSTGGICEFDNIKIWKLP